MQPLKPQNTNSEEVIVLGGGCFWCIEAVFNMTKGVESAISGYAGGHVENPSYEQVCSGTTGHAEVVKVTFHPAEISLSAILDIFWTIHDPTRLNRQGADVGTQYRSIILYTSTNQKPVIETSMKKLNESNVYNAEAVTGVEPLEKFYKAGVEHQDYYQRNEFAPYCTYTIKPKVRKFKNKYPELQKK